MTSTFIKHGAVIIGILVGAGSQLAFAQEGNLQPTPPATAGAPDLVAVRGVACLDADLNGLCAADEAPVKDVILRSVSSAATATDSSGHYTIQAPANTALDVTIPGGYKSASGSLHEIILQVIDNNKTDIILARDGAGSAAEVAPAASSHSSGALASVQENGLLQGDIDTAALFDAMVAVTLFSFLTLVAVLISLRRIYTKSLVQQSRSLKDQQERDLDKQMQSGSGWQAIAEQIVADALLETVSIDEQIGVLEAAIDPNPRFTIVTQDRRTIVFTTAPKAMKKSRLIKHGDRIIDVTATSCINHTSVCVLWQHILAMKNMYHVTLPSSAHWYLVVHASGSKIALKQKVTASRVSAPRGSWLSTLKGGE